MEFGKLGRLRLLRNNDKIAKKGWFTEQECMRYKLAWNDSKYSHQRIEDSKD